MVTVDAGTARLRWAKEEDPRWDADRERVFGTVPEGVFRAEERRPGDRLSGDWWRVESPDGVIGYGWLDDVWGDAEILLAIEADARGTGAGAFALARLEEEAAARGLNYVLNVVRDTHPERDAVVAWFQARGFAGTEDGRLRKQVSDRGRDIGQHQRGRPGTGRAAEPDEARRARYVAERDRAVGRPRSDAPDADGEPLGPGAEEQGGYVDQEQHRF
ncbi:N-acetylglutamate synthase, GNAT family [Modestobacter sp. DSM 44400]|uniref:GNAT family N-acetyltransferase n=1 Tax=Modestobacter sp. DSM 44400 TaxID=1550230 RepID=UPI000898269B|nr:GNAT family N-acetyltransferase [Modestobacter sp. DSM 44400]SDX99417.1 N-acetylglutamate synthase, GNAT family [Modestobacter sp. DSM 44400]